MEQLVPQALLALEQLDLKVHLAQQVHKVRQEATEPQVP
jgi:hypothetical protein